MEGEREEQKNTPNCIIEPPARDYHQTVPHFVFSCILTACSSQYPTVDNNECAPPIGACRVEEGRELAGGRVGAARVTELWQVATKFRGVQGDVWVCGREGEWFTRLCTRHTVWDAPLSSSQRACVCVLARARRHCCLLGPRAVPYKGPSASAERAGSLDSQASQ